MTIYRPKISCYLLTTAIITWLTVGTHTTSLQASSSGLTAGEHAIMFQKGVDAYELGEYRLAMQYWLKLARNGDPMAARNVGHLFENGLGVQKNIEEAIKWYDIAAESGVTSAQLRAGLLYVIGDSVERDLNKAVRFLSAAARAENSVAQYNLGLLYEKGYGVPNRDHKRAAALYYYAASSGHMLATKRLAALVDEHSDIDFKNLPDIFLDHAEDNNNIRAAEVSRTKKISLSENIASQKPSNLKQNFSDNPEINSHLQAAAVSVMRNEYDVMKQLRHALNRMPDEIKFLNHQDDISKLNSSAQAALQQGLRSSLSLIDGPQTSLTDFRTLLERYHARQQHDKLEEGFHGLMNFYIQVLNAAKQNEIIDPFAERDRTRLNFDKSAQIPDDQPVIFKDDTKILPGYQTADTNYAPIDPFAPANQDPRLANIRKLETNRQQIDKDDDIFSTISPLNTLSPTSSQNNDIADPVIPDPRPTAQTISQEKQTNNKIMKPTPRPTKLAGHQRQYTAKKPKTIQHNNIMQIQPAKPPIEIIVNKHSQQLPSAPTIKKHTTSTSSAPRHHSQKKHSAPSTKQKTPYVTKSQALSAYRQGHYQKAFRMFNILNTKKDDPEIKFFLGKLYNTGQGTVQNKQMAKKLWQQAAHSGHQQAATALANLMARISLDK